MGHDILKQQRRLELVDECLRRFAKPMNVYQIAEHCNRVLGIKISTRQYKYDIEKIEEAYDVRIHVDIIAGKKCYTYSNKGFSIKDDGAVGQMEQMCLKKVMDYLGSFSGLGVDAGLCEITDEIGRILGYDKDDNAVVSFEKTDLVCYGKEKLDITFNTLFKSIIQGQTLNVKYIVPGRGKREWVIFPQFLKQYNQRWYLIAARHRDNEGKIVNLALDRIETVAPNNNIPYVKSGVDFADYFADVVGVTKPEGSEPQEIILQVEKGEYPYIESKPIHPSQDELFETSDKYVRISLFVHDNYELRSKLLSYGNKVTVVEPQSLRDKLKDELQKALDNYK